MDKKGTKVINDGHRASLWLLACKDIGNMMALRTDVYGKIVQKWDILGFLHLLFFVHISLAPQLNTKF